MAHDELAAVLGGFEGFEGFELVAVVREPATGTTPARLILELQPVAGHPKRCRRCGERVAEIHDIVERRVRDLPVAEWDTWVRFPRARLAPTASVMMPTSFSRSGQPFPELRDEP